MCVSKLGWGEEKSAAMGGVRETERQRERETEREIGHTNTPAVRI